MLARWIEVDVSLDDIQSEIFKRLHLKYIPEQLYNGYGVYSAKLVQITKYRLFEIQQNKIEWLKKETV